MMNIWFDKLSSVLFFFLSIDTCLLCQETIKKIVVYVCMYVY